MALDREPKVGDILEYSDGVNEKCMCEVINWPTEKYKKIFKPGRVWVKDIGEKRGTDGYLEISSPTVNLISECEIEIVNTYDPYGRKNHTKLMQAHRDRESNKPAVQAVTSFMQKYCGPTRIDTHMDEPERS